GTAHPVCELLAPAQLLELGLPGHRKGVCRTTTRWHDQRMGAGRRSAAVVVAVLAAFAVLGCGGSKKADPPSKTVAQNDPGPIPPRSDLALPANVPDRP